MTDTERPAGEPATTDLATVATTARDVATFDDTSRVIRIPTPVPGLLLEFKEGQTQLDAAQMRLLSPLRIKATWDPNEVMVFLLDSLRRGFDPWAREAFLMVYKGHGDKPDTYVHHVGIAGFRRKGEESGEYRGRTPQQWCGPDGQWREVWLDGSSAPAAARVGILREGFAMPTWGIATYDEFCPKRKVWARMEDPYRQGEWKRMPTGQEEPTEMWRAAKLGGKPSVMLAKCAEAQAWRAAFPNKFNGWYAPEEMEKTRADTDPETVEEGGDTAQRRRAAYEAAVAEREQVVVSQRPDGTTVVESTVVEDAAPLVQEGARELYLAEMAAQAAILERNTDWMTRRWSQARGGRSWDSATDAEVQDHVCRFRPYVVTRLRELGRHEEATAYEQAGAVAAGTLEQLFGRDPAQPAPAEPEVEREPELVP